MAAISCTLLDDDDGTNHLNQNLLRRMAVSDTGSRQRYEVRHVRVRASSQAAAEAQLVRAFAAQEAPYFNEAGYLVRWYFDCFTGGYDSGRARARELFA